MTVVTITEDIPCGVSETTEYRHGDTLIRRDVKIIVDMQKVALAGSTDGHHDSVHDELQTATS